MTLCVAATASPTGMSVSWTQREGVTILTSTRRHMVLVLFGNTGIWTSTDWPPAHPPAHWPTPSSCFCYCYYCCHCYYYYYHARYICYNECLWCWNGLKKCSVFFLASCLVYQCFVFIIIVVIISFIYFMFITGHYSFLFSSFLPSFLSVLACFSKWFNVFLCK